MPFDKPLAGEYPSTPQRMALGLAVLAVPALVVFCQARDAARVRECDARMQKISAAFQRYLAESPGALAPKMAEGKYPFTMAAGSDSGAKSFFPEYLDPADYRSGVKSAPNYDNGQPDDSQLLYIGYMLEDDADLNRFLEYYEAKVSAGEPLEDAIPLGAKREDGRDKILRTRKLDGNPDHGVPNGWYQEPAEIPVFIERIESHATPGTHVIFLDGHVAFYPHSRGNIWPITRLAFGKLKDAESFHPDTRQ